MSAEWSVASRENHLALSGLLSGRWVLPRLRRDCGMRSLSQSYSYGVAVCFRLKRCLAGWAKNWPVVCTS